jgi:hypothetical protein
MGALDTIADKAAEKLAQKTADEQEQMSPTEQALVEGGPASAAQKPMTPKAKPAPAKTWMGKASAPTNPMSAIDATRLKLSGSDVASAPGIAEPAQGQHVAPGVSASPPPPPDAPSPAPVAMPVQSVPPVAKAAPTTKEMISRLLMANPGGVATAPEKGKSNDGEATDWVGMLKGASGKLGDFLQRWGLGLQGKGDSPTRADILQAQQFELEKQGHANDLAQRNMALDNTYQMQRMAIMQEYGTANMTAEKKAQLDNQLKVLDQQYQNEKALLPQKIALERQQMQYQNSVTSASPNPAVATILKGK